ncbi:MAG: cytochrome b [Alphaproteobacteria bacterium]|nr:cytochrome b [Alphaproteobacteria bacterium]
MSASLGATQTGRASRPVFVKVWDPFVRLFHWSLVLSFAFAWISADEWDLVHEYAGYIVAGLIGSRLIWGLIGTRHARFSNFVYRPSVVLRYLKDSLLLNAKRYLGHNPAGGAMILALLLSLIAVSATGIMMTSVALGTAEWIEELHEVAADLTLGLVVLHMAGVMFSSLKHRENLVRSMFTGLKRADRWHDERKTGHVRSGS